MTLTSQGGTPYVLYRWDHQMIDTFDTYAEALDAGIFWTGSYIEIKPGEGVNPILAWLRAAVENWNRDWDADGDFDQRYAIWLNYAEQEDLGFEYTPEELEHARKVLARLAALV